jgi:precorrin-6B methylase 1
MWRVKVDLAYRVAYLLDNQGESQAAQSSVTTSTVDPVLASWGYTRVRDAKWECTDILNAIDAMQCVVERIGS